MSIFKNILQKKGNSNRSTSNKSSEVASLSKSQKSSDGPGSNVTGSARSVKSKTGLGFGSSKAPNRKKAEISTLGYNDSAKFFPKPPKELLAEDWPGTQDVLSRALGQYTSAYSYPLKGGFNLPTDKASHQWGALVLFTHAPPGSKRVVYHNEAIITGQLRIDLDKPTNIASIDIWIEVFPEHALNVTADQIHTACVNLFKKDKGERHTIKGKLPAGTYVMPFEFKPLPANYLISRSEGTTREYARIPLPSSHKMHVVSSFSGSMFYNIGVNIERGGMGSLNDEFTFQFTYHPRQRKLQRQQVPFPFIGSRDSWPFMRESIGGWTITPFGSTGKFKDDDIEIEGLLGVESPPVYGVGDTVKFHLLLWSPNKETLKALSDPNSITVEFCRTDLWGEHVLRPDNLAHLNREVTPIGSQGRIQLVNAGTTEASNNGDDVQTSARQNDNGSIIRLEGDVVVQSCNPPPFRYPLIGVEYILRIVIAHNDYKPTPGTGIPGTESPLWVVAERSTSFPSKSSLNSPTQAIDYEALKSLQIQGDCISLPEDFIQFAPAVGEAAAKKRPSWKMDRMSGF